MSLLSQQAKDMIASEVYAVLQTYQVMVPSAAGSSSFEYHMIHNDKDVVRVTDHGVLAREAFNQTMKLPGALVPGNYSFEVGNLDRYMDPSSALWLNSVSGYQAAVAECRVSRFIQLEKDGATAFIGHSLYVGQIRRVEYFSKRGVAAAAVVHCGFLDESLITRSWDSSDYDEIQLSSTPFGAPIPGEN